MNKKEDIYKDDFIKQLVKDVELEETSDQFTNQVMDQVMQDWLAKPIEMNKPISRNRWMWIASLIFLAVIILLGTDVHKLISASEHPFLNQLDAMFLHPINLILNQVLQSLIKLPVLVYIVAVAFGFLAAFDRVVNKLVHYR
ncbi:MAG: hypothetical protein JEZ01_10430 [Labilibaculum sp.]|nr:hypothetical protein [Labilibaculum sp.]MBI9058173.1 hypothetical protein [Labilibaculum sp.]